MDEKGENFEAENKILEDNGGGEVKEAPVDVQKNFDGGPKKCCK